MANFTLNEALSSIIVFIKVIRRRLDKFRNIKKTNFRKKIEKLKLLAAKVVPF